jgi:S-methylmethionine-dependent homocysteine/selenocysteine methylase
VREAVVALAAARETGLPVLVSFVCGSEARLLSGELLAQALCAVAPLEPDAVGVNCLPPSAVGACLPELAAAGMPFAVYANLGAPDPDGGFTTSEHTTPTAFADLADGWRQAGAAIVGGCCGTRPAHVRALRASLDRADPRGRSGPR